MILINAFVRLFFILQVCLLFLQVDDDDDSFPQNICIECQESALKSYAFRIMCETTTRLLRDHKINCSATYGLEFNEIDIKSEADTSDEIEIDTIDNKTFRSELGEVKPENNDAITPYCDETTTEHILTAENVEETAKNSDNYSLLCYQLKMNQKDTNKTSFDSFNCNSSVLENLHWHRNQNKDPAYACNHCEFDTYSLFLLSLHDLTHHDLIKNRVLSVKNTKTRECKKIMGKRYANQKNIKWRKCEHKYKTRYKTGGLKLNTTISKDFESYQCAVCSYKTISTLDLERHFKNKHTKPANIKWHKCEYCKYKTKYKHYLEKHITIQHAKPKDLQWYNDYKNGNNLEIRKKHKTPDYRHQCTHCDYKGYSRYHVERHTINRHVKPEDIVWHHCAHCDYKAKDKHYLTKHTITKHVKRAKI